MTIIVFLVDTSASMNQRTYAGTTVLDVAKNTVELFMKIRSRDPICRWDRYMLLTFDDPPSNVKAGWKETHSQFMKELKSLEAFSLTTLGSALKNTFELLNTNRGQTGIDTYGQGRCPFFLEPAIIICITDGNKLTHKNGATVELTLPMNNSTLLGAELTKEPFRWDQRLYGVMLKLAGLPSTDANQCYLPSAEGTALDAMCEVTGGRSYAISSHKALMLCLESLVSKCQSGVVVSFEKIQSDFYEDSNSVDKTTNFQTRASTATPQPWHSTRKMIYVPRSVQRGGSVGSWPIPEAFWPDASKEHLPARSAHPVITFSTQPIEPPLLDTLPFDKYELEPSLLTQYLLEKRQPNMAWQVFVGNSSRYSDLGLPFGYLKANSNNSAVNLVVMPYNYPLFVSLIDDLLKVQRMKPSSKWKMNWDSYLKSVPPYYANPLKRALARMNLTINLIPDQMENCLSYNVVSHLKKIKNQAKIEFERSVASVSQTPMFRPLIRVTPRVKQPISHFNHLLLTHSKPINDFNGNHMMTYNDSFDNFSLNADPKSAQLRVYTNPFDIHREALLETVSKMRLNFMRSKNPALKHKNNECLHNQPVSEMGNYQEHLKRITPPLREIENAPTRINTFGNPFKVKNMMIDEADEAMPGSPSSSSSSSRKRFMSDNFRPNKRKPGPLPKTFTFKEFMASLSSAPSSPSSSPVSSPSSFPSPYSNDNDMNNFVDHSTDLLTNHKPIINHLNSTNAQVITNGIDKPSNMKPHKLKKSHRPSNQLVNLLSSLKKQTGLLKEDISDFQFNKELRDLALIEIRKPGNNFNNIATLMNSLRGDVRDQRPQIERAILEAKRFKKQPFIDKLSAHLSSLT